MEKDSLKIQVIGRCTLHTDDIFNELPQIIIDESYSRGDTYKKIWQDNYEKVYAKLSKEDREIYDAAYNRTFSDKYSWKGLIKGNEEKEQEEARKGFREEFTKEINAAEAMGLSFKCWLKTDDIAIVSLSETKNMFWLFPARFITITEYKNYGKLTGSQRKAMLSGSSEETTKNIITANDKSYNEVITQRNETENSIDELQMQMDDVKNAKIGELKDIQAQIETMQKQLEQKKRSMLDVLEQKKAEMKSQLEEMEKLIFKLDSEIYTIRCYTGEVIEVNHIRKGKPADPSTPIVFHQKIRYMDEELGRYSSIYNANFDDAEYFEKLLAENDEIFNLFVPSERGISLIRVSRNATGYKDSEFPNMLENYEKYHGKKIAILIKDGENLYMSWTDDDRINFSEDAFLRASSRQMEKEEAAKMEKGPYESEASYEKRLKNEQDKALKEMLGRYYTFSLLQGMLDRDMIKLPEKIKIADSKYVVFSYADGWISDNRYGTFESMLARCNEHIQVGDDILTMQSLRAVNPDYRYGSAWCNDRGRGQANRTHDVYARDNEIYKINLVEHYADYEYIEYPRIEPEKGRKNKSHHTTDASYQDMVNSQFDNRYWKYKEIKKIENTDGYNYFISLKKEYSLSGTARANFQVYPSEFANLTFLNSTWLEYILINNKTGKIRIGGKEVDFAFLIPYLKHALSFTRKREIEIKAWLQDLEAKDILTNPEWPAHLSEWMLKNNIHNFSKYRTKQFVKAERNK